MINVKDCGATGDGSTDDSLKFDIALAAVANGGTIYCPPGNYRITKSLTLPRRVSIIGDGLTSDYSLSGRAPTCIIKDGNFDGIVCDHETRVANLQVNGAAGNGGDGIYVKGAHVRIEGVTISNHGQDGLRVGGKTNGLNSDQGYFAAIHLLKNGRYGLYVHDVKSVTLPDANACIFIQVDVRENVSDGIRIENAIDNNYFQITTQVNTGWGINIVGSAKGHQFWFPYSEGNTAGSIQLNSGVRGNVIFGTRSASPDLNTEVHDLSPIGTNTVVGRDPAKRDAMTWKTIEAWQYLVTKSPHPGLLALQQVGDGSYEARNISGNNACTFKVCSDGPGGVGILVSDRLTLLTLLPFTSNANAIAGGLTVGQCYRNGDNVCVVH